MDFRAEKSEAMTQSEIAHMNAVKEAASECIVLLENDGTLPIKPCKVALFGNGARHTVKGGTGSGLVNSRFSIPVSEGLKSMEFEVTTEGWLDRYDAILEEDMDRYIKKVEAYSEEKGIALSNAYFDFPYITPAMPEVTAQDIADSATDTAILVISRDCGEGADRTCDKRDFLLGDDEIQIINTLRQNYAKFIILLNVGGVIDLTEIKNAAPNALAVVSQCGNMTGHVVAEFVGGATTPSGKLTDTWARYEDYPSNADFNSDRNDEFYTEGIYVGYRYFDTFGVKPIYPFGYGKSYTTFSRMVTDAKIERGEVVITAAVSNTGDTYSGKEVIQVYTSSPEGLDRPYRELRAFAKTKLLAPGDTQILSIKFPVTDLAHFRPDGAVTVIEAGKYPVRVGTSSADTKIEAVIEITEEIITQYLRNLCTDDPDIVLGEIKNPGKPMSVTDTMQLTSARQLQVTPAMVRPEKILYSGVKDTYEDHRKEDNITLTNVLAHTAGMVELVAQMSDRDLAKLCVGSYSREGIDSNAVWAASSSVPGAAAETTNEFKAKRNIPSVVMADGPAGLRLQPHFKADKAGNLLPGGEIFGLAKTSFPDDTPADATDYWQYCTAIPIATGLAQTWNMELIEKMGKIVGEECERFGVNLWLAPGMNIHRNPLCGRNFEYYSEDPLMTGLCAAAITDGVQSFESCGTTIKHFCCNNRETNRMFNNSHVSERALRDIYLKGFEIAVKKSRPLSVMMSYNLLNGIHTANSYELIQNILRDEWGFEGVVMTDWYSSFPVDAVGTLGAGNDIIYPEAKSPMCIYAGCDWQMPGCEENVTDIVKAIDQGRLSRGDLQYCAMNILRLCMRLM